jgi:tetratricopeptide (TPR) repeat protein
MANGEASNSQSLRPPLIDAILEEQSTRWERGERPLVEEFIARYPTLEEDQEQLLDLVYNEFLLRRRNGDSPRPEEYVRRFPARAKALIRQFAAHEALRTTETLPELDDGHAAGESEVETNDVTDAGNGAGGGRSNQRLSVSFPGHDLLSFIGQGGMGVVYKARDIRLQRVVALKTITEFQTATPGQLARFLDEAHAAARLQHPNIITIHSVGEHEGRPYFALEFADGGDLKQRLANGPMAPRAAAELVETLAKAVHAAHQAGIVHRDLKPANILLTGDGVPKVTDFGLAKLVGGDSGRTRSGEVIGSPSYMAPEQAEGHARDVGPPADVYALGAILYETLTGRPPFLGASALETIRLVTSTDAVAPRRLRNEVPRDLETICLKCLQKEPAKRYMSASALADDLRRFLDGRPIAARPVRGVERAWRAARRNPILASLAAALLLTFALGTPALLVLWLQARDDRAQAMNDRAQALRDRASAQSEAATATAVTGLFTEVLSQANPNTQATPTSKPDPDLRVRDVLDRVAQRVGTKFSGKPEVEAVIQHTIGEDYFRLGLYAKAQQHLEQAVQLFKDSLGTNNLKTFQSMAILVELYLVLDKRRLAKETLTQMRDGFSRLEGPNHPDVLVATNALGQLYLLEGKPADASEQFATAFKGLQDAVGNRDIRTVEAMNNLGMAYQEQHQLDKAEPLLKEAMEGVMALNGPDHPDTLTVKQNLGEFYFHRGKLAEAEEQFRQVLETRKRVLKSDDYFLVGIKNDLGVLYLQQHKLPEGVALLKEVVEGRRKQLGPTHSLTLTAMSALAQGYTLMDDLSRAAELREQAFAGYRDAYGKGDPGTLNAMATLGELYMRQGKKEKAKEFLEKAAERLRTAPGVKHPDTLRAMSNLASFYVKYGKRGQAEPLLEQVVALRREVLGKEHSDTLGTMEALGAYWDSLNEHAKAEAILRECLGIRETIPEDWMQLNTRSLLGGCLARQRKYEAAEKLLVPAYEKLKAREPRIPPSVKQRIGEAHQRIIDLYDAWGKPDHADRWRATLKSGAQPKPPGAPLPPDGKRQ